MNCDGSDEENQLRSAYTDLVSREDGRKQLVQVAKEVQLQLANAPDCTIQAQDHPLLPTAWSLTVPSEVQASFSFRAEQVSTVGTRSFNDIVLSSSFACTVSRLHVVFLPLPETGPFCLARAPEWSDDLDVCTKDVTTDLEPSIGQLLVCDVGSLNGIKIVERSRYPTTDASKCQSGTDSNTSKPCSRSILVLKCCFLLSNLVWLSFFQIGES